MRKSCHGMKILTALLVAPFVVGGCGGDGGDGDTNALTGHVADGPIEGANVSVVRPDGTNVAGGETSSSGGYSVDVPAGAPTPLTIESEGGTEHLPNGVTREAQDLASVTDNPGGTVNVSPLTTVIAEAVEQGQDLDEAKQKVSTALGVEGDPISEQLDDPAEIGNWLASEQRIGELIRKAQSKADNAGLDPNTVLEALASDAADGQLDGTDSQGNSPPGIQHVLDADAEVQTDQTGTLNFQVDGQSVSVNAQNMGNAFGDAIRQEAQTHAQEQQEQGTGSPGGGG